MTKNNCLSLHAQWRAAVIRASNALAAAKRANAEAARLTEEWGKACADAYALQVQIGKKRRRKEKPRPEKAMTAIARERPILLVTATAEGLAIDYDTRTWEQLDAARAALGKPNVARLLVLLAHAVKEADGWHDDSRSGPIEGDALIDEARALVTAADVEAMSQKTKG